MNRRLGSWPLIRLGVILRCQQYNLPWREWVLTWATASHRASSLYGLRKKLYSSCAKCSVACGKSGPCGGSRNSARRRTAGSERISMAFSSEMMWRVRNSTSTRDHTRSSLRKNAVARWISAGSSAICRGVGFGLNLVVALLAICC